MNEEKGTYAERNVAKRLENEAVRMKRGYLRGTLLPTITYTAGFILCMFAVRYFCIDGTLLDNQRPPVDRYAFHDAERDYLDGNFDDAARGAAKILAKQPHHADAHEILARIALARGDRAGALEHLHSELEGTLERERVTKWIAGIEALPAK